MVEQVLVSQRKVFLIVKPVLFSQRKVSANLFGSKRPNILTHFNRTFVLLQPNILLILPNICALWNNIPRRAASEIIKVFNLGYV